MSSIVLAHDLTERSAKVAEAAVELGAALNLPLVAVHAIGDEELASDRDVRPPESAFTDYIIRERRDQLEAQVRAVMASPGMVALATEVLLGDASEQLPEFLRANATAYAFVGVRSRSRVGKLLFGSVTQAVLLQSGCRVVSVPVDA